MYKKRMLHNPLALLLIIGVLLFTGRAIRQSAWNQGYLVGRTTTMSQSGESAPAPPTMGPMGYRRYDGPGMHHRMPLLGIVGLVVLGAAVVHGISHRCSHGMDPEAFHKKARSFHKRHPHWSPRHAEQWREFRRWHDMCEPEGNDVPDDESMDEPSEK